MKHIASVSFGKDSLAMLLLLIEKGYPLDEVVFYDTGMEFDAIYIIIDQVKPILDKYLIDFVVLKPKNSFEYDMYNRPVKRRDGTTKFGYGWCGGVCRWGTTAKLQSIYKYCQDAIVYVGIASDEVSRFEKEKHPNKVMPLVDFGFTESDCLEYCHRHGFYWYEGDIELYQILKRVSCWCCRNKNLKELEAYKKYLPDYFGRLQLIERRLCEPMKKPYYLKDRFKD